MNTRGNIFTDIAAAVKLTGEVRKARKEGADAIRLMRVRTMPVYKLTPGYYDTGEGCALSRYRNVSEAVEAVYDSFDADLRYDLSAPPERGKWVDRMRFWEERLRPVLPPRQYHAAMLILIRWGSRCVRRRLEAAV